MNFRNPFERQRKLASRGRIAILVIMIIAIASEYEQTTANAVILGFTLALGFCAILLCTVFLMRTDTE
jgi:hypothetical protein